MMLLIKYKKLVQLIPLHKSLQKWNDWVLILVGTTLLIKAHWIILD